MKLNHISMTARDADRLASFYREVFRFSDRRPAKILSGDVVSRGNGLPGVSIYSLWLAFPDARQPFLEILQYSEIVAADPPAVHAPGFGHIAFEVSDLHATVDAVLRAGGTMQGEVTNFGTPDRPHLIVYLRDPEGNILELEQPFVA